MLVVVALFVLCFGLVGLQLLRGPEDLLRWTRARGVYIPFLESGETRFGQIMVRVVGFVFFVASLVILGFIIFVPR